MQHTPRDSGLVGNYLACRSRIQDPRRGNGVVDIMIHDKQEVWPRPKSPKTGAGDRAWRSFGERTGANTRVSNGHRTSPRP